MDPGRHAQTADSDEVAPWSRGAISASPTSSAVTRQRVGQITQHPTPETPTDRFGEERRAGLAAALYYPVRADHPAKAMSPRVCLTPAEPPVDDGDPPLARLARVSHPQRVDGQLGCAEVDAPLHRPPSAAFRPELELCSQ